MSVRVNIRKNNAQASEARESYYHLPDDVVLLGFKQRLTKRAFVPLVNGGTLMQPQNIRFNIHEVPTTGKYEKEMLLRITKHKLGLYDSPWNQELISLNSSAGRSAFRNFETEESSESELAQFHNSSEHGISFNQIAKVDFAKELMDSTDFSIKVQRFVEHCHYSDLSKVAALVKANIYRICVIKQGSYLIQRLITRYQPFEAEMVEFSKENFEFMASKDFSCRILRVLLRRSEEYRVHITRRLQNNLSFCLSNFSSIFLITESIKISKDMREFDFLVQALSSNPQTMLANRYFKRILVTLIEHCSSRQLKSIAANMSIKKNFRRYMNDKFGCQIFLILLQRGDENSYQILREQLFYYHEQVLRTKYYGYIMLKAVQTSSEQIKKQLLYLCLDLATYFQAANKPDSVNTAYFATFHLYCAIKLWQPDRETKLSLPLSTLTCKLTVNFL